MAEMHETELGQAYMKSVIRISEKLPELIRLLERISESIHQADEKPPIE